MIRAKYLGLVDDNYFFEWKFSDFYADTTKGSASSSNKVVYELIGKTVNSCPIRFMVGKSDFKITVLNESQIDSVAGIVKENIASRVPSKSKDDHETMKMMLDMLYGLKMDDAIYKHIREYFRVYTKLDLIPNEKRDIKSEMKKKGNGGMSDGAEGFAVFEDTDPKVYKYKYQSDMDLSKMLGDLAKAFSKDDSTTDKINQEMSKTKMGTEENGEIIISKPDMVVTSFYEFSNTNGNLFAIDSKEREMTLLKAVK